MKQHELYISRCIQLAKAGIYTALPNPSVGAVVVHNNKIIGEGYTSPYGGAHAEVKAIESVKDKGLLQSATLYVSLEPCSHFGKTPPCCDLVIKHNIPRVVVGTVDPFAKVQGQGIQRMRDHNIEVIVGVLEQQCIQSNIRFFTFHQKKRPYIILKWAQTSDGFIAPLEQENQAPFWISNTYSKQLVHQYRSQEKAFLVGTHTVEKDNPSLTTRDWYGLNPLRIFIDKQARIKPPYTLVDQKVPTLVITQNQQAKDTHNLTYVLANFDEPLAPQICAILHSRNISSVVIEGGSATLNHFIAQDLWDKANIFIGPTNLHQGIKAPVIENYCSKEIVQIQQDILQIVKR